MSSNTPGRRVLGRLRLSVAKDESTSIPRQREVIEQWATMNGHTIVGWAEDVDVSGSIDPFEAPALGEWLDHRAPEWDTLCVWKLDRLSRNAIHLNKLFGWCLDHDKTVVSCSESIDLSTPVGRLIANVIAFLAEGELEAIRERSRSSRAKLRELARWPGGKPPYGYLTVDREDGPGKRLVIDPAAYAIVRRIVDTALEGGSLTRLAAELTAEGIRTPAQYYAALRRNQPGIKVTPEDAPGKWHVSPLRNMLRNKALRGHVHHDGQTVRDSDGQPLLMAEPLVTDDEWELVQAHLDRIQESRRNAKRADVSPLAGVVVCYFCGSPLHHTAHSPKRGRDSYAYYKCPSKCTASIPVDELLELMEEKFLDKYANQPLKERVWVPGDSRETELRENLAALDELTAMVGRLSSATAKGKLAQQIAAVDARIAELESAPAREARWEYRATGGTYGEEWQRSTTDERREMLVRAGMKVRVGISLEGRRSKWNSGAWQFIIDQDPARPAEESFSAEA
ncbi:recombinase family protein [Mycolicibacterium sp. Y3]